MKPRIDLTSPLVQLAISYYKSRMLAALNLPQNVEKAVIPICVIPKTKAHSKQKFKPEQIGSGVLVNIKEHYFIFSATHALLELNLHPLITASGNGSETQQIKGERLSTGNPNNPRASIYDASVYHVKSLLSDDLKEIALTLSDFDFEDYDPLNDIYLIAGFRVRKSNTSGNMITSKMDCFPSVGYRVEEISNIGFNPETHIILAYEDKILFNNIWQNSPRPKGMSGGAIMKAKGTGFISSDNTIPNKQLLTAITIEQHREKNKKPGFLVGTRVNIFLEIIHQFFPELCIPDLINDAASSLI